MWKNSSNKYTKIIALTTPLNDQRMKFEYLQKNYNEKNYRQYHI